MPPKKRRRYVHIYILRVLYLFIIIKKRKGRLIKHVLLEIVLAFFFNTGILWFFTTFREREQWKTGCKKGKKKRERYPPPQRVGNTHPTYLSFLLAFIPLLPLVVYILIYFYLHPLVFTKEEVLKWWGYFTRFLFSTLSLPSYISILYFCRKKKSRTQKNAWISSKWSMPQWTKSIFLSLL